MWLLIAGIVALICEMDSNLGGAIVALGVGCILTAIFSGGSDDE